VVLCHPVQLFCEFDTIGITFPGAVRHDDITRWLNVNFADCWTSRPNPTCLASTSEPSYKVQIASIGFPQNCAAQEFATDAKVFVSVLEYIALALGKVGDEDCS